jgi:hypothetical protein
MNQLNGQTNTNENPEIEQETNTPGGNPFGWPGWWANNPIWNALYEA